MQVPVLTYHSMNVNGTAYAENDHIALAVDLRTIHSFGARIVPLHRIVDSVLGTDSLDHTPCVGLSFDDGSWFDWHDLEHPTFGPQRSFANILRDFRTQSGADVHATSFVIVSPDARQVLDRTCMIGRGWWGHDWWPQAEAEGLVSIGNHSWDHNHHTLPSTAVGNQGKGTFAMIDDATTADAEIQQASIWLNRLLDQRGARLFAYPYGESSEFLRDTYLPGVSQAHHGVRAAFGTQPSAVTASSPRWNLPRFVCGKDWTQPGELARLLDRHCNRASAR